VRDRFGNIHRVVCQTLPGEPELEAGREILVLDYDKERGVYLVQAQLTRRPAVVGLEVRTGRLAELEHEFRRQGRLTGHAAHAIGAEVFATHARKAIIDSQS